ncbi:MAG: TonB-dependent receptor [Myxococcota bacterium]|nr:TonB-dependent receptor [Myxococcota bacterium]
MHFESHRSRRKCIGLPIGTVLLLLVFATSVAAQDEPIEGEEATEELAEEGEAAASEDVEEIEEVEEVEEVEEPVEAEAEGSLEIGAGGVSAEGAAEAPAEPAAAEDDEDVETIVVTGTRIGRSNLESYANITVISSEDIQISGVTTVDELLRQMPSMTLQGINKQNNNGGDGLARVDLRNLGSGRTLVLLNGKRIIGAYGGGVDMNNIPMHMVERIEILLDGASAVYGSDAVAGVVNIVYKDDFDGFRADVAGGISTHGDGENITVSATMGGNHDNGNMVLNLTYYKRNEAWEKDRDWAEPPTTGEWYETDDDGNLTGEVITLYNSIFTPAGIAFSSAGAHYFNTDGTFEPYSTANEYNDPDGLRYSYGLDQFLVGKMERVSVTTLGDYEISEFVTAYMEGDYTHRQSFNQLAPQPLGMGTALFPGPLPIYQTNPWMPEAYEELLPPDEGVVWMYKRMWDIGRRQYENTMDTFRVITGLRGEIGPRFSWDAFVNYSRMFRLETIHNSVNLRNTITALDPDLCAADLLCPGIANVFGRDQMQDDVAAYIRGREQTQSMWDMAQTGLSLTGKLVELPGGYLTGVVGGDFRWERGYNQPDTRVIDGASAGNISQYTGGDYNVQEAFIEFSVPILKDMPGADELTIDLAGRISNYNTFGSEFTYRAGMAYGPLPDVKLRGVYSTAFRAPRITDLYGGSADSYPIVQDPCVGWENSEDDNVRQNCQDDGVPEEWNQAGTQIRTNVGSNPDLGAETATQINGGIVLTPTFIPKSAGTLTATFDFYMINVDNAISSLDAQTIVDRCYASPGKSHEYCQYVGNRGATNDIMGLVATQLNVAEIETKGMDFTLGYGIPITPAFRVDFNFYGNVLLQLEEKTASGEIEDRLGTIASMSNYNGALSKFRFLADLTIGGSMWKLNNTLRYIGPVEIFGWEGAEGEADDLPTHDVKAMMYWNISAMLMWKGLDFIVGMDNVLEPEPPYIPTGDANSNANTYDFLGRYVYAKIGYQF